MPMTSILSEGDGIKSKLSSKIFSTLLSLGPTKYKGVFEESLICIEFHIILRYDYLAYFCLLCTLEYLLSLCLQMSPLPAWHF